ncbi:MAG: helix-turn-helix domain-containing protein [bacterium]|nr:helix-turn-helix domain-containing protein [bacterium]MCM1375886.1 helix-turn-helix domain-containing protein [Muribaculum sp.]
MEFSEKLYCLRMKNGIYQKQLAAYLHVSTGTISNYENGVHSPDLKTLAEIAKFFHVSVDYLLDRTEYTGAIDDLNKELTDSYTTAGIIETISGLSHEHSQDLIQYLEMLKLYDQT